MSVLTKFTHKCDQIKNVFCILKELITEINIQFDQDGVSMCGVDPEKISIIKVQLLNLNTYVKPFVDLNFGVHTQSVYKVIRNSDNEDEVTFIVYNTTPLTMDIQINEENKPVKTITRLTCVELPIECISSPSELPGVLVDVPRKILNSICKDLSYFSNKIEVQVLKDDNTFIVLKSSGPLGVHTYNLSELSMVKDIDEDIQQSFYIRHLEKFTKSCLNPVVTLCLRNESPLIVKMSIPLTGLMTMYVAEVFQ